MNYENYLKIFDKRYRGGLILSFPDSGKNLLDQLLGALKP